MAARPPDQMVQRASLLDQIGQIDRRTVGVLIAGAVAAALVAFVAVRTLSGEDQGMAATGPVVTAEAGSLAAPSDAAGSELASRSVPPADVEPLGPLTLTVEDSTTSMPASTASTPSSSTSTTAFTTATTAATTATTTKPSDPPTTSNQGSSTTATPSSETSTAPTTAAPTTAAPTSAPPTTPAQSGSTPTTTAQSSSSTTTPTTQTTRPTTQTTAPTTAAPAPTRPGPSGGDAAAQQAILDATNAERASAGCPALRLDPTLNAVADGHSEDMSARGYFSHTDPEGRGPGDRINASGYPYRGWGENIAAGYGSADSVMNGWMNSSGHRANILNCSYNELGVGYAESGRYWTQVFATRR